MKKVYKFKSSFSKQIVTFTVDEELTKQSQGKVFFPKKLEEMNKLLRELKTPLPR